MNSNHAKLMPSPQWAAHIQDEVLPQATAGVELGADLLELGPGPGAATDWLRRRVARLVAVEQEDEAAARLAARYAGTNVEVVYNPVEPAAFLTRLQTTGFTAITLRVAHNLIFTAYKGKREAIP